MFFAQHGHAADAASRPQDWGVFEGWERCDGFPALSVAASLMPKPLDGSSVKRLSLPKFLGTLNRKRQRGKAN